MNIYRIAGRKIQVVIEIDENDGSITQTTKSAPGSGSCKVARKLLLEGLHISEGQVTDNMGGVYPGDGGGGGTPPVLENVVEEEKEKAPQVKEAPKHTPRLRE